jgi:hypothetical protein
MDGEVEHLGIAPEFAVEHANELQRRIHLIHRHGAANAVESHALLKLLIRHVRNGPRQQGQRLTALAGLGEFGAVSGSG